MDRHARWRVKERPNLSWLALVSFVVAFSVARLFTALSPDTVLIVSGAHVHHFWFGLALLALGGWVGISYEDERVDRVAAVLFGAGGGLIGDEVGLLLTLGNYESELTFTIVIVFLAMMSLVSLLFRFHDVIKAELADFVRSSWSLYVGVFLAGISIAFVLETSNATLIVVSTVCEIAGLLLIVAYFVRRFVIRRMSG